MTLSQFLTFFNSPHARRAPQSVLRDTKLEARNRALERFRQNRADHPLDFLDLALIIENAIADATK